MMYIFTESNNIDAINDEGKPALYLALELKTFNIALLLFKAGARYDIQTRDLNLTTPLHFASAKGYDDIVSYFIVYV